MSFGWEGSEWVYIETICNFLFFTEYIMYGLVKIPIKKKKEKNNREC